MVQHHKNQNRWHKKKKKKEGNPGYDTVKTPPTNIDIEGKKMNQSYRTVVR